MSVDDDFDDVDISILVQMLLISRFWTVWWSLIYRGFGDFDSDDADIAVLVSIFSRWNRDFRHFDSDSAGIAIFAISRFEISISSRFF